MIHLYEHKKQPLATRQIYLRRLFRCLMLATVILFICLMIGTIGYHFLADAYWLDAFHNASMILSGMGPVIAIHTTAGKWFSSLYALFSGIVFITNIGIVLSPVIHRFFHRLHVDDGSR
ncbi:MAG: hypothetical protein ACKO6Q_08045 [Bacteroidota bacterium]